MNQVTWSIHGTSITLDTPLVMGILNVTPDSFYSGGRVYTNISEAISYVEEMVNAGASIIDIGGESTRPNAEQVSVEEELRRVLPVLKTLQDRFPQVFYSVDTYKAKVAREAIESGVHIINDISACSLDENLLSIIAEADCGYVLMHMQGNPQTMQIAPYYNDVITEVYEFFENKLNSLEKSGLDRARIVIDPGIGFGKRLEDNLKLISNANSFHSLGRPLLYGVSRKSFLGKLLNRDLEDRLPGSVAAHIILLLQGVKILRVHDVGPAIDAIKVYLSFLEHRPKSPVIPIC